MEIVDKESPFQPGQPVDPDKFKGRKENIKEISRYLKQISNGKHQNFFINGKRGIGKSSFARYMGEVAKINCNMISIHLYLNGVGSVKGLVREIITKIVSETEENWKDRISKLFGNTIKSVEFGGLKVEFNPSPEQMDTLTFNFPRILINILEKAGYNEKNGKKGLFIVIDDINGLTGTPDFANWYKSFNDTLSTDFPDEAPIFMVLSGLSEKKELLFNHNPSFSRIFHYTELEILKYDEIREFYLSTLKKIPMEIDEDALKLMIDYCSGLPTMMHEIGDAVFWEDEDFHVDLSDALTGILNAGKQIGDKYLRPIFDSRIKSEKYMSIFRKIGDHAFHTIEKGFTKKELSNVLTDEEMNVLDDFIRRAKDLGIIELSSAKKFGTYQFTNNLYPAYLMIDKLAHEQNLN
ncbi:MAG: ATP-binding protein [Methanobrevibacter sp.]|jgi:AAA+ ATPase superfamily predicted ATPase|nr:ATP-binding protein [Candidatus Methanovirga aequatorialis]